MTKKAIALANLIPLLLSVVLACAVLFWAPVCQGRLALANGLETHMKCFYTGKATLLIALVLFVVSLENLLMKRDAPFAYLFIGLILFMIPLTGLGIGVCTKETMACQTTALWLKGIGILTILSGIGSLLAKGKDQIK